MPVLLDYLVAQVVRVPDPIGDTFIFFATIVCSYYLFFVYMHFKIYDPIVTAFVNQTFAKLLF